MVGSLKNIFAVLFIFTVSGVSSLQAQEKKQVLTPEMKRTLDDAINHLKRGLDAHNKKMEAIENRLFATPEKVMELCQSPMRPKNYRAVLTHFKATKGDPVSFPKIDCLFIKDRNGGALLWSYKPAEDKSYYMLRAHEGLTPRGSVVFARHPLNFHHRLILNGKDWVIKRSTFTDEDAFPIKKNSSLVLTEQREGEEPVKVTAKVVKSFPIVHQIDGKPTQVETLHIIVKDLAPKMLQGKLQDLKRWYIYSEKANIFIQRSHALTLQDSKNKAGTGVNKSLSDLSYIKDGQYILKLSAEDLAPLRAYIKDFDVWSVE